MSPRRPPRRAQRIARVLNMTLLLLVLGAVTGLSWLLLWFPSRPGPSRGASLEIELTEDTTLADLSDRLGRARIVDHPGAWLVYMRLLGAGSRLRVGRRVRVTDTLTPAQMARRLAAGFGPVRMRVTLPEGLNRFEVAERLEQDDICLARDFIRATEDPSVIAEQGIQASSLEGYLFPDTYEIMQGIPARRAVDILVRNFRRRVLPLVDQEVEGMAQLRRDYGFGLHEVITLASIVEEEAAVEDERPIIARVFLNRLASDTFLPRHRLQADPTVTYGCVVAPDAAPSCQGFDGRHITRTMTQDPRNAYNTYRHEGLPPGPIANPGLSSIRAVLRPDGHDYLYFVVKGGGRHHFSSTLAEHNEAVARYRERQRQSQ